MGKLMEGIKKCHLANLLIGMAMLAVFAITASGAVGSESSVDAQLDSVCMDASSDVEKQNQQFAGKKKKGGTRRIIPRIG